jgi:hypothetical protein
MPVYGYNGDIVDYAECVNELEVLKEGRRIKEIKTLWSGKLTDLVVALVGEFSSIESYGRIGSNLADSFSYNDEKISDLNELLVAVERNIKRARELLDTLNFVYQMKGNQILEITDEEV